MKTLMNKAIRRKLSARHGQRGLVIVEMVFVLPVVLFLTLAVAEIGNAILQYNTLTHAVRDGARYVANRAEATSGVVQLTAATIAETKNLTVYGKTTSGTTPVLPGLVAANISVNLVTIVLPDPAENTDAVAVTAQYQYQPIFITIPALLGGSNIGGAFTMNAQVVMRILS